MLPRVLLLFGSDLAVQREVANELADLLPRSSTLGFDVPLRRAFMASYGISFHAMLESPWAEKCANFVPEYRAFFREWAGESILGSLVNMDIHASNASHCIIEDGDEDHFKDIKEVVRVYRSDLMIVNLTDARPLKGNGFAMVSITELMDPCDIATLILEKGRTAPCYNV